MNEYEQVTLPVKINDELMICQVLFPTGLGEFEKIVGFVVEDKIVFVEFERMEIFISIETGQSSLENTISIQNIETFDEKVLFSSYETGIAYRGIRMNLNDIARFIREGIEKIKATLKIDEL